jgi:farnesyl diphosphate synthase
VILEDALQELLSDTHLQMPPYAREWVKRVLEVNIPGGKMNRGLTVAHSLPLLKDSVSENEVFRACVLGWAIEAVGFVWSYASRVVCCRMVRT